MSNKEYLNNCKSDYWIKTPNKDVHYDIASLFDNSKYKDTAYRKHKSYHYSHHIYLSMLAIWRHLIETGELDQSYKGLVGHFSQCHAFSVHLVSFQSIFKPQRFDFSLFDDVPYEFDTGQFHFNISDFKPKSLKHARQINEMLTNLRCNPSYDRQHIPVQVVNSLFGINLFSQIQFVKF